MNINRPDENYMKIVATELFAQKHNISTLEAFHFLDKYNLYSDISEHYNALHTQPLDEVYYFVEDIVANHYKDLKI